MSRDITQRRGRDSNPRRTEPPEPVFETGGLEVREEPGAAGHAAAALRDLDLAVCDEQVCALVDLMLSQLLAGRQADGDRAGLVVFGVVRDAALAVGDIAWGRCCMDFIG